MAWYIILAIAGGGGVGLVLIAVLIYVLVTKYKPQAKVAPYTPMPPTKAPGFHEPAKVIQVCLVTHASPAGVPEDAVRLY